MHTQDRTKRYRTKRHITPAEWQDFLQSCENVTEKALFSLIYQGVLGREAKHIRSLRVSDVLYEQGVVLTASDWHNGVRAVPIDDDTLTWLHHTANQPYIAESNDTLLFQAGSYHHPIPFTQNSLQAFIRERTVAFGWVGVGSQIIRDSGLKNAYIEQLKRLNGSRHFERDLTDQECADLFGKSYDLRTEKKGMDVTMGMSLYRSRMLNLAHVRYILQQYKS